MIYESLIQSDAELDPKMDKKREQERAVFDGGPVNDYIERQVQLAVEMQIDIDMENDVERPLDSDFIEEALKNWTDSPLSKAFQKYTESEKFLKNSKVEPELQGNYAMVTLEDVRAKAAELKEIAPTTAHQ